MTKLLQGQNWKIRRASKTFLSFSSTLVTGGYSASCKKETEKVMDGIY